MPQWYPAEQVFRFCHFKLKQKKKNSAVICVQSQGTQTLR